MTLDDATTQLLSTMEERGRKPFYEMSVGEARAAGDELRDLFGPGPEVARVTEEHVPVPGGSLRLKILSPEDPRAVMVFYHGGGFVLGSPEESETVARNLVHRANVEIVMVDYRLAPEHRYPTAVEDAWAALRWTARYMDSNGRQLPLIVQGVSAGGNLAAVVAQRAKAEKGPEIALQILAVPVTDSDMNTASYLDPTNQFMLGRKTMSWFWDHYAPDPESRTQPDASPLRGSDLSGLPPAIVITAEHDVLRDEGEAYAEKLRAAGVPVQSRRFDGQVHGFLMFVDMLPGYTAAADYLVEQLDRQLGELVRAT